MAEGDGRPALRESARAKINLYLHITGRRGDGYHLLDTLVVFADLGDELCFRPAPALSLKVSGPFGAQVPAGADNLVLAAARALAPRGRPAGAAGAVSAVIAAGAAGVVSAAGAAGAAGAAIGLRKNLPAAAGLGGGSADAAAALRGLARLWGLRLPAGEMAALALTLGADVPVCLGSRPARVAGVGELLHPPPALPALALLLVNPGVALSSGAVFANREGGFQGPAPAPPAGAGVGALAAWLGLCENGLEVAAVAMAPQIAAVLAALRAQGGCLLARMSGSGATCFGLFGDTRERDRAAAAIAAREPGWWLARAACPPVADGAAAVDGARTAVD